MDAAIFCEHFDLLVDSPSAIAKVRELILQLAVQGRLVTQDPKEEPAATFLARLDLQQKRPEDTSSPHTPPFPLPATWEWARFDRVATIASNLVQPQGHGDLLHVAPDNIEKETGRLLPCRTVAEDGVRSSNHRFYPGQILYSKIRPNLSKVVVVDFEGLCSADMYPINSHIDTDYLQRYMLSTTFRGMAVRNDTRVAMPKINQEELNRVLVAVPPLAEQRRIVAKVDALMSLCDELEAKLTAVEAAREATLSAAVQHLLRPRPAGRSSHL